MRYPKEHKEETRRRILDAASWAFRAHGVAEVSIGDLMRSLGLTHGGFYAHFPSKEALVAEACRRGLDQAAERLTAPLDGGPPEGALRQVIDSYLDARHRDTPATGCVMPALAGDIAREPGEVRHAFTEALQAYLAALAALMPSWHGRADDALVLASGMAGALMLARAVDDPDLSDRLLAVCRSFYTTAFADNEAPDGLASPA
jgi:TetR/AcrR family transcriptional repressor of nem operon